MPRPASSAQFHASQPQRAIRASALSFRVIRDGLQFGRRFIEIAPIHINPGGHQLRLVNVWDDE